jgi:hypothetical protein
MEYIFHYMPMYWFTPIYISRIKLSSTGMIDFSSDPIYEIRTLTEGEGQYVGLTGDIGPSLLTKNYESVRKYNESSDSNRCFTTHCIET